MHEPIFPRGWNGRYGLDQLSIAMAALSCFLSLFLPRYHRNGFFTLVSLFCALLLLLALWRTLSRDTSRRWAENEKFLRHWNPIQQKITSGWNRLRDRDHRYFRCPGCGQTLRVPKGRGTVRITCPRCRQEIIRKT